jgi:hypothetical protein
MCSSSCGVTHARTAHATRPPSSLKAGFATVPATCAACARLVDAVELLVRFADRRAQLAQHCPRTRAAANAAVGELEATVDTKLVCNLRLPAP